MNAKNIELIQNKIKKIKNKKNKIFYTDLKEYNYSSFITKCKKVKFVINCIDDLSNGCIIVLKNSIRSSFLENAKKKLEKFAKETRPINPKIKSGIKNGFYLSKNLSNKGYKTVDRSFYFFSWNKDKLKIYRKIINLYKPLKILNGLRKNQISKNKPRDGVVERLHIINYPLNSGQISRHYDPVNVSIFNFGLYNRIWKRLYQRNWFLF